MYKKIVAFLALCAVAFAATSVTSGILHATNKADTAVNGNVERCESGNELRAGLRHAVNFELKFYEGQLVHPTTEFSKLPSYHIYAHEKMAILEHNRDVLFAAKDCHKE